MAETILDVPIRELIPILSTVAARDWEGFKKVEEQFVTKYGAKEWQDFFADRLKPLLDKESDNWFLTQKYSTDILSGQDITFLNMAITNLDAIVDYFIYVANDTGSYISNLKLQKLVYYAQAWHLGIHDTPLFDEDFEAWVHGRVIPSLFYKNEEFGAKPILKEVEQPKFKLELEEFLEEITEVYFICDGYELELMATREDPWIFARKGLERHEPSHAIISKHSMRIFYKERAA